MFTALAIGALASLLGALPWISRPTKGMLDSYSQALHSMILRFGATVTSGLILIAQGDFHTASLLIWLVIVYLLLLPVDTVFAIRSTQSEGYR